EPPQGYQRLRVRRTQFVGTGAEGNAGIDEGSQRRRVACLCLTPKLHVVVSGQNQSILNRNPAAELFDARNRLRGRVFEMSESDPLPGEGRLAVDLFDDGEQLPRGIVLRRVQVEVVARSGEET